MTATPWFIDPQNLSGTANDANDGRTAQRALRTGKRFLDLIGRRYTVPRGTLVDVTFLSDMNASDRMSFEVTVDDPATAAFRLHGSLVPLLQGTVTSYTAETPSTNTKATLVASGVTSAHVGKLFYFPASNAWAIATACPSSGTIRLDPAKVYGGSDLTTITRATPANGATFIVYNKTKGYFGSVSLIAAWNVSVLPAPWPSPFIFEDFECPDLVTFDGVGGIYQPSLIRQCSFTDVIAAPSSSDLFRACSFTAQLGATSNFAGTTQKPVSFSGCVFFGGDVEMSGARFGVGAHDSNAILCSKVSVDRSCRIQGQLDLSTQGADEESGLWVSQGVLAFTAADDVVYGTVVGNNALVLADHASLRYPAGVQVYTATDARQLLVGGLGATTSLTPTLTSASPASCDTWAKLLASPFNGAAYNADELCFVRAMDADPGPSPAPQPLITSYADVPSSLTTGATIADGKQLTAWGPFTTIAGAPHLADDTVSGGKVVRTGTSDRLLTSVGDAAFLLGGAFTIQMVWRYRTNGTSTRPVLFDSTESGTKKGIQILAGDFPGDITQGRTLSVRQFDGTAWFDSADTVTNPGVFVPQKNHVVTIRVSSTLLDIRVDGQRVWAGGIAINKPYIVDAASKLAIGGGNSDYKAVELYASWLTDSVAAAGEIRLSSRFNIPLMVLLAGDPTLLVGAAQSATFPFISKLPNGKLYATVYNGIDGPTATDHNDSYTSSDGGATWVGPVVETQNTGSLRYSDLKTSEPLSDGSILQVTFTYDAGDATKNVIVRRSTDSAVTWSAWSDVLTGTPFNSAVQSAPVEDPTHLGTIHMAVVTQESGSDTFYSIWDYKTSNAGSTWARVRVANGVTDSKKYAEPGAWFKSNGELRYLIRDATINGTSPMLQTRSTDQGATWAAIAATNLPAWSSGQQVRIGTSGREVWIARQTGSSNKAALFWRAAGAAYNAAWENAKLEIDPLWGGMYYAGLYEVSAGTWRWILSRSAANNSSANNVGLHLLDEWVLDYDMPGDGTPHTATVTAGQTQQITATGAGGWTFPIDSNDSGSSIDSTTGVFTAGSINGTCVFGVVDINGKRKATCTYTVTGGGGAWDPSVLGSRVKAWLDADVTANKLVLDGNGRVAQATDRSGNAKHASAANTSNAPAIAAGAINGKRAIDFGNGVGNLELLFPTNAFSALTSAEVFFVGKFPSATPGVSGFWSMGTDGSNDFHPFVGNTFYDSFGSTVRQGPSDAVTNLNAPFVYNAIAGTSTWTSNYNRVAVYAPVAHTVAWTSAPKIGRNVNGSSPQTTMLLGEWIVVSPPLSGAERTQMLDYLSAKWATP